MSMLAPPADKLPGDAFRTAELLLKHIQNRPENSRIITFQPEVAMWVLEEMNMGNRPRKPAKIVEYANAMAARQWGLTGDTIKFGSDGMLKDGQNRLAACVRSGCEFRSHVVFGIDPNLFVRMDIGKNRSPSDAFSIAGIPNANEVAAAVRWLVVLTSDNPLGRSTYTPEYLLERFRESFSGVVESINFGRDVKRSCDHPVGNIAALHYLFAKADPSLADDFMFRWANGRSKGRGDPVVVLQRLLQSIKSQNQGRVHDGVRNALIIKAWNADFEGTRISMKRLQWQIGDDFPTIAS